MLNAAPTAPVASAIVMMSSAELPPARSATAVRLRRVMEAVSAYHALQRELARYFSV